jgi:hypothetical protein
LIALTKLRDLDLAAPLSPGRPAYLSAASGLVRIDDVLYVVADDEHHLGVFRREGHGTLLELIEGELPADAKARKKAKPDFEALVRLPAFTGYPHGALLASGSGSKPHRRKGALIGLDANDSPAAVHVVDLGALMDPLVAEFGKINLEGMAVRHDEFCVFQRGNKGHKRNAVIRFVLADVLAAFTSGNPAPLTPLGWADYDLGEIAGVPLTFTDGAALPDGALVFCAAAEDTDDSYTDGACGGAAIGLINPDGTLAWIQPVREAHKIEGLDARQEDDALHLLLVTDADDIEVPAGLFAATVSRQRGQSL